MLNKICDDLPLCAPRGFGTDSYLSEGKLRVSLVQLCVEFCRVVELVEALRESLVRFK